ncbi:hypothetical protein NMY22_g783 [Coprinellus aureogranulatus]|nr:hypothetical protein NMY22_g783 [Coprinellus aureogranulatus]
MSKRRLSCSPHRSNKRSAGYVLPEYDSDVDLGHAPFSQLSFNSAPTREFDLPLNSDAMDVDTEGYLSDAGSVNSHSSLFSDGECAIDGKDAGVVTTPSSNLAFISGDSKATQNNDKASVEHGGDRSIPTPTTPTVKRGFLKKGQISNLDDDELSSGRNTPPPPKSDRPSFYDSMPVDEDEDMYLGEDEDLSLNRNVDGYWDGRPDEDVFGKELGSEEEDNHTTNWHDVTSPPPTSDGEFLGDAVDSASDGCGYDVGLSDHMADAPEAPYDSGAFIPALGDVLQENSTTADEYDADDDNQACHDERTATRQHIRCRRAAKPKRIVDSDSDDDQLALGAVSRTKTRGCATHTTTADDLAQISPPEEEESSRGNTSEFDASGSNKQVDKRRNRRVGGYANARRTSEVVNLVSTSLDSYGSSSQETDIEEMDLDAEETAVGEECRATPSNPVQRAPHLENQYGGKPCVPYSTTRLLLYSDKASKLEVREDDQGQEIFSWKHSDGTEVRCTHPPICDPSSTLTMDDSCAALGFFTGLYYSPVLGIIIRTEMGGALPLGELKKKFNTRIYKQRMGRGASLDRVVKHVAAAFSMEVEQSQQDVIAKMKAVERLVDPIPGVLYPAQGGLLCPSEGCSAILKNDITLKNHLSGQHSIKAVPDSIQQAGKFQKIPIAGQGSRGVSIALADGWEDRIPKETTLNHARAEWTPADDERAVPNHLAALNVFINENLGWGSYCDIYGGTLEEWRNSLIPPTVKSVESLRQLGLPLAKIEAGLLWLTSKSGILLDFLREGDEWVSEYCVSLREKFKEITKIPFEKFQPQTNSGYKTALVTLFCFMIRGYVTISVRHSAQSASSTNGSGDVGKKVLEATAEQLSLIHRLVQQLVLEKISESEVKSLVREIMISLMETPVSEKHGIACVVEQCTAIVFLTRDNRLRRLNLLTGLIARFRRALACAFIYLCMAISITTASPPAPLNGTADGAHNIQIAGPSANPNAIQQPSVNVNPASALTTSANAHPSSSPTANDTSAEKAHKAGSQNAITGTSDQDGDKGESEVQSEDEAYEADMEAGGGVDDDELNKELGPKVDNTLPGKSTRFSMDVNTQDISPAPISGGNASTASPQEVTEGEVPRGAALDTCSAESNPATKSAQIQATPALQSNPTPNPRLLACRIWRRFNGNLEIGVDIAKAGKGDRTADAPKFSLEKCIEDNKSKLHTKTSKTASGRLWHVWKSVGKEAMDEPSSTEINWQGDRKKVHITAWGLTTTIQFEDITQTGQRLAEAPLQALKEMFPPSSFEKVQQLPSKLAQCSGLTPVFRHEQNKGKFEELISELEQKLVPDAGRRQQAQIKKVLQLCSDLQESILAGMVYSMGIPARPWQLQALVYSGEDCNILTMDNSVVIAFPKAKQREKLIYAVAWVLPATLGLAVLAYFGVVRPVEMTLLRKFGVTSEVLTRFHSKYMFVRVICRSPRSPRQRWLLDTSIINGIVKRLGLGLSCGIMRHLVISILQEYHPDVCRDPSAKEQALTDAIDSQAQHTKGVGDTHYGGNVIRKRSGLSPYKWKRLKNLSQTWHTMLGLSPKGRTPQTILFAANINQVTSVALSSAQKVYGKAASTWDPVEISQHALKRKSWSQGPTAGKPYYGDRVLVDVLAALICGDSGNPSYMDSEMESVSDERILQATKIIVMTLHKLANGNTAYVAEDEVWLEHDTDLDRKFIEELGEIREEHSASMDRLEELVHKRLRDAKQGVVNRTEWSDMLR